MCFVELHADRDFEASLRPGVLTTRSAIPAASACMVCETFPSRSGIHWQYFTCTQLARVRSLFGTITSAQLHRCCFFCCALARMQTQRMPRQQFGALMMHARSTLSMPFEAWLGLTGRLAGQVVRWCCFAWVGGAAAYRHDHSGAAYPAALRPCYARPSGCCGGGVVPSP